MFSKCRKILISKVIIIPKLISVHDSPNLQTNQTAGPESIGSFIHLLAENMWRRMLEAQYPVHLRGKRATCHFKLLWCYDLISDPLRIENKEFQKV